MYSNFRGPGIIHKIEFWVKGHKLESYINQVKSKDFDNPKKLGYIAPLMPSQPEGSWRHDPYYDKRFLSWDSGSYLYQIPAGDTVNAQIARGTRIVAEESITKTALTLPTRQMEVAIYAPPSKFLAKIEAVTILQPRELLELAYELKYRSRLGLVESQAVIPRVSEAIWVMLKHRDVNRLSGGKQWRILNPVSYKPRWMLACANRQGSRFVKVGNWNEEGIHIEPIKPEEENKIPPPIWIVPQSFRP